MGYIASAKAIIVGLLLTGVVTTCFLGYRYVVGLQIQVANAAKLEVALGVQKGATDAALGVIDEWKQAQRRQQEDIQALEHVRDEASTELRRLNKIFGKHDLELLARGRPTLVAGILNRGTASAGRMLVCATTPGGCSTPTGSPPAPAQPAT